MASLVSSKIHTEIMRSTKMLWQMINSKFLLPIFIILTCKLSGFICSLHFTSQSCFPYSHAVVNWSPSQHPVIIMASFSSNCLEILSEYVWHSELLPLRFTWVNILFKIFHFYIVSETNNWCPLPTLQHLKDYLPVPPAVSHQQVKTRIYFIKEKCLMEFKIVDFLKSTEY